MVCHLLGLIVKWNLRNELHWNSNQNSSIFIHENTFEDIVWKMVANLSQPQRINNFKATVKSLKYKAHLSRQLNCRSLRCSWSIACRRCSNYIFILYLTPGFNRLGKDKWKTRRGSFKFCDLVRLILEILRYLLYSCQLWLEAWEVHDFISSSRQFAWQSSVMTRISCKLDNLTHHIIFFESYISFTWLNHYCSRCSSCHHHYYHLSLLKYCINTT